MDGKHAKTLLTILEILKRETDINHTLTQKQIQDRLVTWNSEDPIICDRRVVKRNITALQELGFPVVAKAETSRMTPNRKTGQLVSGSYPVVDAGINIDNCPLIYYIPDNASAWIVDIISILEMICEELIMAVGVINFVRLTATLCELASIEDEL